MSQGQPQSTSNLQLSLDQAAKEREQADLALAQLRAQLNANTSKIASLAAELEATQKQLDHYAYNLPVVERQKLRADKRLNALREHADKVAKQLAAERRMQEYLEELQRDDEEGERRLKEYLVEVLSRETEGFSDSESDVSDSWSVLSDNNPSKVQARQVASLTSPVEEMKGDDEPRSTLGLSLEAEDLNMSGALKPTSQPKPSSSSPPLSLPQSPPTCESSASLVSDVPPTSDRPLPPPSSFTPAVPDNQARFNEAMPPLSAEIPTAPSSPSPHRAGIPPIPAEEKPCPIPLPSGPAPPSVVSTPPDLRHAGPGELGVVEALPEERGLQDADLEQSAPAKSPPSTSPNETQLPIRPASPADAQQPLGLSLRSADHQRPATPRVRASSLTSDVAPLCSPSPAQNVSQETHAAAPTSLSPRPSNHIGDAIESIPQSNPETTTGSPRAEPSSLSSLSSSNTFAAQPEALPAVTSQSPKALAGSRTLPSSPQRQSLSITADADDPEESGDETDSEPETDGSERIGESCDGAPATQLQKGCDGQDDKRHNQAQPELDDEYDDEGEGEEDDEDEEEDEEEDEDEGEEEDEEEDEDKDNPTNEQEIVEQEVPEDVEEEGSIDGSYPKPHDSGSQSSPAPSKVDDPSPTVISAPLPCPSPPPKRQPPTTPSAPEARPDPSSSTTKPSHPTEDSAVTAATTSKDVIASRDASKSAHPTTYEAECPTAEPAALCSPPHPRTVHVYPPSRASNAAAYTPPRRDAPYHPKQLLSVFRSRYGSCANPSSSNNDGRFNSHQDGVADSQSVPSMNHKGRPQRPVLNAYSPQASASTRQACSQA